MFSKHPFFRGKLAVKLREGSLVAGDEIQQSWAKYSDQTAGWSSPNGGLVRAKRGKNWWFSKGIPKRM